MGANSSDDHEQHQQVVVVGSADNDIDHHHHHQLQQQQQQYSQQHVVIIRYKCSFCDRGFSNAQALGGHMNVHRRDRAAKFINNNTSSSSDHQSQLLPWINNSTKLDQEVDDDIHVTQQQHHKPQQLPLFVDTVQPSRLISCKGTHEEDDDHEVINTKRQLMIHDKPASTSSHGHDLADKDDRKLDLELRLGPHDPEDSTGTMSTTSTTTGTRDFF